jgi:hypothetical protein
MNCMSNTDLPHWNKLRRSTQTGDTLQTASNHSELQQPSEPSDRLWLTWTWNRINKVTISNLPKRS